MESVLAGLLEDPEVFAIAAAAHVPYEAWQTPGRWTPGQLREFLGVFCKRCGEGWPCAVRRDVVELWPQMRRQQLVESEQERREWLRGRWRGVQAAD